MVSLRAATEGDIGFMMSAERQPGYDLLVGRFSAAEHLANLNDPAKAYRIAVSPGGEPLGFVLFRDINDPQDNLYIKRVVVAAPEKGTGTAMMRLALDWAFTTTSAYRVWLTHIPNNRRAHALYTKLGFQQEGVLRGAYGHRQDQRGDLVQMSLLKPEWDSVTSG
ncbi:GNAT family N-acetyltransferase [Agrobacterium vitis]|uniref:GNAT family N-acetyltransferase n=1 Tax=Agrobacterium vitis TaxID=373 RepID=A0AAE2UXW0_AGRVI|nr:GNAT family protein [Agrobacterium vitis]MBF2716539.1 GNAT family N-acetyltransferase [Agrobacterium vitis]MUZ64185.1 GNAT family N-acetyltransferase [Agrobacterium vitis]MVA21373.1 GNAT family N-acetyltransferase [Agrobacterium vitis]